MQVHNLKDGSPDEILQTIRRSGINILVIIGTETTDNTLDVSLIKHPNAYPNVITECLKKALKWSILNEAKSQKNKHLK